MIEEEGYLFGTVLLSIVDVRNSNVLMIRQTAKVYPEIFLLLQSNFGWIEAKRMYEVNTGHPICINCLVRAVKAGAPPEVGCGSKCLESDELVT
jgi:hypothetical protein